MDDSIVNDDSTRLRYISQEASSNAFTGVSGHGHGEKLETFTSDLRKAVDSSYPRDQYPYSSVDVLFLHWAEDDLHIQLESNMLKKVFDQQFGFQTEDWEIPSQNATRALQKKIYDFQDAHQSSTELLILYYGGRAETDPRHGSCIWQANQHKDTPSLDWSSLQHLLETAVPHVLIVLDCCYVPKFAKGTVGETTKELIAASGQDNAETGPRCRTFTSLLTDQLRSFKNAPFTVAMLYSQLVAKRQELMFSPVHVMLSIPNRSSINLAPLSVGNLTSSLTSSSQTNGIVRLAPDLSHPHPGSLHDAALGTGVLFAVSVVEREVLGWVGWLTTHPPWDVTQVDIRVESVFDNDLTIVLITVPIFVWDRLQKKSTYRFISFVKSANHLKNSFWNTLIQTATESRNSPAKAIPNGFPAVDKNSLPSQPRNQPVAVPVHPSDAPMSASAMHAHPVRSRLQKSPTFTFTEPTASFSPSVSNMQSRAIPKEDISYVYPNVSQVGSNQVPTPTHRGSHRGRPFDKGLNLISDVTVPGSVSYATLHRDSARSEPSDSHILTNNIQPTSRDSVGSKSSDPHAPANGNQSVPIAELAPSSSSRRSSTARNNVSGVESWHAEDDRILLQARRQGLSLLQIASNFFPNRTPNACRKRYERLLQKRIAGVRKSRPR